MIDLEYVKSYVTAAGQGTVCGLHEMLPDMVARLPDHAEPEILEACRTACAQLIEQGYVMLRMVPAFAERPTRDDYIPVEPAQIAEVLASSQVWEPPVENRARYWVTTTEEGVKRYLEEEVVSL